MFAFAYPWLLLLTPLPILVCWLVRPYRSSESAVRVPFMARLVKATGKTPTSGAIIFRRSTTQWALLTFIWLALVGALARPQWIEDPISRTIPSRDLMLAVDLSGSMETADFVDSDGERVDRLTGVKAVLDDFLTKREGDRVGLIFFGSAAFLQSPFTEDLDVCRQLLDEAQVRMAGPQTVIGDAIGLSIVQFEKSELEDRVLILLTDGNDTGSKVPPANAAQIASDKGITIYPIGIGDPTAVGEEKMDEESLREIARTTNGEFYRAEDLAELAEIYERLDELDTKELETVSHRPKVDLFQWPLMLCFISLIGFHAFKAGRALRGSRKTATEQGGEYA